MTTPDKCMPCPRETTAQSELEKIEIIRDFLLSQGDALLDDDTANILVNILNEFGIAVGIELDAALLRQKIAQSFEWIEQMEAEINKQRHTETQFCIGALRMRAKDQHSEYTVAICRSPQPDKEHPGDVQLANVQKRTI